MRKPTRPLARRVDERQPAPYQQRSPEPVFCNEHERCQGCPYPAHGVICWHRGGGCLRTDKNVDFCGILNLLAALKRAGFPKTELEQVAVRIAVQTGATIPISF